MKGLLQILYYFLPAISVICGALVALSSTERQRKKHVWLRLLDGRKLYLTIIIVICVIAFIPVAYLRDVDAQGRDQLLREAVAKFAGVEGKTRQEQPDRSGAEIQEKTYDALAKQLGIDPDLLRQKLPKFAEEMKRAPGATIYERANAAYVTKDYAEAERLALIAADEAHKATPPQIDGAIQALELAGVSADARVEYADALKHFKDAQTLTDRIHNPLQSGRIHWYVAHVLQEQGKYAEAKREFRNAITLGEETLGAENPAVVDTRMKDYCTRFSQSPQAPKILCRIGQSGAGGQSGEA